jgi:N-acetylglucosaminyldiphosphoundecaprenol N-acetyl-beta-D-mannosaminyltransferase
MAALKPHLDAALCRGERPLKIFTPNATIASAAHKDTSLHALLQRADWLLPDGRGVLIASRLAKTPISHRLAGIEVGEMLLSLCASSGAPVYFFGGAPGIAEEAAQALRKRLPGLRIVGTHHGYLTKEDEPGVVQSIRDSGARAVLVCLGFPGQERWIDRYAAALPDVRILIGLGGSFDVWSGRVRRAPRLFRALGLEWLWRSIQKPSRLRTLFPVIPYFLAAKRCAKAKKAVKI